MARFLLLSVLLLLVSCAGKLGDAPAIVFTVLSHDAASHIWVVDRVDNMDKVHTQYSVVCDYYKWGARPEVTGPSACDLQVGESFTPDMFAPKKRPFSVMAWVSNGKLVVQHKLNEDKDYVMEQFSVKTAKTLPYSNPSN